MIYDDLHTRMQIWTFNLSSSTLPLAFFTFSRRAVVADSNNDTHSKSVSAYAFRFSDWLFSISAGSHEETSSPVISSEILHRAGSAVNTASPQARMNQFHVVLDRHLVDASFDNNFPLPRHIWLLRANANRPKAKRSIIDLRFSIFCDIAASTSIALQEKACLYQTPRLLKLCAGA